MKIEFMVIVGSEKRNARATKGSKELVIWWSIMKFGKRGNIIQHWGWHSVNEKGSCMKLLPPKR